MKKVITNRAFLLLTGASILTGLGITSLMEQNSFWYGWFITSLMLGASSTILYSLYKKAGAARLMGWMVAVSFILRLGLGITLMKVLPVAGYDTEQQKAGYVFYDAFRREWQAMDLARSDNPILTVFTKKYATDQYGGYLGLSVFVYRVLSGGDYRPHLMLILSALAAAAGVPFLWMILSRLGEGKWQKFAGWWYVLYPQAVLMGASQMREPYLITLVTIAFWAALAWQNKDRNGNLFWMLFALAGLLLLSPGVAVLILIISAGWIWIDRSKRNIPVWFFPVVLAILVIGAVVLAYGLASQDQFAKNSPVMIIMDWFKEAASWDLKLTEGASGQLSFQLQALPDWAKMPFIITYGILQPVLPATLMDTAVWLWRILSSYLAFGWYLILPLIVYGTISAVFEPDRKMRSKMLWFALVLWVWIVICSARAGGDQWDNPRYRAILLAVMVIFAGWSWHRAKFRSFVWLKRIALVEGIFLLFFIQWYAARYYRIFGKMPFYEMVGIILLLSFIIIVGGYIKDRIQRSHKA